MIFPRVTYNSPVVLTFAIISTAVLLLDQLLLGGVSAGFIAAPGRNHVNFGNFFEYYRFVSHIFGHSGWAHLTGNFFLILLLGPLLEEKYGSKKLFSMIFVTAIATALVNAFFLPNAVMGASGIVFMMIMLSGFTGFRSGEFPLTFVLVALIYLTGELIAILKTDNISQTAHLVGGLMGSFFGFRNARH